MLSPHLAKRIYAARIKEFRPMAWNLAVMDEAHELRNAYRDSNRIGRLQCEDSYAIPRRQRHLTELVLRKLLASSSQAVPAPWRSRSNGFEDRRALGVGYSAKQQEIKTKPAAALFGG